MPPSPSNTQAALAALLPMALLFIRLGNDRCQCVLKLSIQPQATVSSEPLILEGRAAGGRFGMSIINLGDIDQDGYEGRLGMGLAVGEWERRDEQL